MAFAAQELKVGFIEGRGDDAVIQAQALELAGIEYEVIGEGDYKLTTCANFSEFNAHKGLDYKDFT